MAQKELDLVKKIEVLHQHKRKSNYLVHHRHMKEMMICEEEEEHLVDTRVVEEM